MDKPDEVELTPEQRFAIEQEMAGQAHVLLNNPAFKEALETARLTLIAGWLATPMDGVQAREEYHRRYLALNTVENSLKNYLETGKMNLQQMEERRKEQSRLARFKRYWGIDQPEPTGVV